MAIDKSNAPTPPPARRAPSQPKQTTAKIQAEESQTRKNRVDGINSIADGLRMGLLAMRQPADAGALERHAPNIANAIADYAETNDKFGESLDRLSDVSPVAGIAIAVVPLLLQVSVNHKLFGLKAEQMATAGIVTPETLISESNEYLMRVQTQAMQREIAAQQELQETYKNFVQMQRIQAEEEKQASDANGSE